MTTQKLSDRELDWRVGRLRGGGVSVRDAEKCVERTVGGGNTGCGERGSRRPRDWNFEWRERKEVEFAHMANCLGFKINKVLRFE